MLVKGLVKGKRSLLVLWCCTPGVLVGTRLNCKRFGDAWLLYTCNATGMGAERDLVVVP